MLRKSEPKLTYALNSDDELVSIKTILVRGNGGRQPHFSHSKDSDCHGSYMTTLHLLAEQIIKEEKLVMAPAYKEIKSHKLVFKHVEIEQRVDRKDLQPDIVGITEDNLRWTIEIFNTHEVDEDKRAKLIESGITCLEIDVSHQTLENLRTFLLESTENRKWINNPNSDLQIATAKRKIISLIKNFIVKKHELSIPPYKKQGEFKNICIQKSTTVEESKDRLLSRVKVTSIDGTALIINIGSRFELDYLIALGECNELNINIDNLPIDTDVISSIEMEWFYNYAFEKERKARAIDDANNPKYEERPLSDCKFKCKYELYNGMCIYQKGTIKKVSAM